MWVSHAPHRNVSTGRTPICVARPLMSGLHIWVFSQCAGTRLLLHFLIEPCIGILYMDCRTIDALHRRTDPTYMVNIICIFPVSLSRQSSIAMSPSSMHSALTHTSSALDTIPLVWYPTPTHRLNHSLWSVDMRRKSS